MQTLTVHHTGFDVGPDPAATVRSIYHQDAVTEAFGDIGYHLLIDAAGRVYEGRWSGPDGVPVFGATGTSPLMTTGGHVIGYNTGNIGVCLLGLFTNQPPTAAARDALALVLADLARCGRVDPFATVNYVNPVNGNTRTLRGLIGHRDWLTSPDFTECPGNAYYPLLEDLRARVRAVIGEPAGMPQRLPLDQPPALPSGQIPTQPPVVRPPITTRP